MCFFSLSPKLQLDISIFLSSHFYLFIFVFGKFVKRKEQRKNEKREKKFEKEKIEKDKRKKSNTTQNQKIIQEKNIF